VLCGGCRARAFALTGDVLAADPSCAYEPAAGVAVIEPGAGHRVRRRLHAGAGVGRCRARADGADSIVRAGSGDAAGGGLGAPAGRREVTPELLAEVRSAMPIDFSKKRPFFVADS